MGRREGDADSPCWCLEHTNPEHPGKEKAGKAPEQGEDEGCPGLRGRSCPQLLIHPFPLSVAKKSKTGTRSENDQPVPELPAQLRGRFWEIWEQNPGQGAALRHHRCSVTPRLGFVPGDVLPSCECPPLIQPVLNVLTFPPRALPEERQMLMNVVGSTGFQISAFSFGPKKKKKKVLLSAAAFSDVLRSCWKTEQEREFY